MELLLVLIVFFKTSFYFYLVTSSSLTSSSLLSSNIICLLFNPTSLPNIILQNSAIPYIVPSLPPNIDTPLGLADWFYSFSNLIPNSLIIKEASYIRTYEQASSNIYIYNPFTP